MDFVSFMVTADMKKTVYFTSRESTERHFVGFLRLSIIYGSRKPVREHESGLCSVEKEIHESRYTKSTVTTRLSVIPQGTCTWTQDRAFPLWWAHQDTLTCLPWATQPWQVTKLEYRVYLLVSEFDLNNRKGFKYLTWCVCHFLCTIDVSLQIKLERQVIEMI